MNRKRRAATRSYRISVDAKPKKIKSSAAPSNAPSTSGNNSQAPGQPQASSSLPPPLDVPSLPSQPSQPSQPSVSRVTSLTTPDPKVGPVNLDAANEPADVSLGASHVAKIPNADGMAIPRPRAAKFTTTPKYAGDYAAEGPVDEGVAERAEDVLLEDPTGNNVYQGNGENVNQAAENPDSITDSLMVFSCAQCRVTVSDSSTGYNFNSDRTLLSVRGAQSVKISDELKVSKSGPDVRCTFHAVICTQCGHVLGKVYSSTNQQFDHHRNVFTFDTDRLKTYCVGDLHTPSGEDISSLATKLPLLTPLSTNVPTLDAFEDLDAHVNTVTDAVNNVTDAIRDLRRAILDIRAELNTTKTKVNDGEDALSKLHNVVSLWEARNRKNQTSENHLAPIIPMLRSMERRLILVENKVTPVFTTKIPQITDAFHTAPSPGKTTPGHPDSASPANKNR